MTTITANYSGTQRRQRLYWLMIFRIMLLTALLASTVMVHISAKAKEEVMAIMPLYAVVVGGYIANLIFSLMFRWRVNQLVQAYLQLIADLLLATIMVYLTGGVISTFSFLFIITVIMAGMLLPKRGAIMFASLATITYGCLLTLQMYGIVLPFGIPMSETPPPPTFISNAMIHTFGFYMAAILTAYLASQAQQAGKQVEVIGADLSHLKEFHKSVLNNLPFGVITQDSKGDFAFHNPIADRFLELARKKIFPQNSEPQPNEDIISINDSNQGPIDLRVQHTPLISESKQTLGKIITLEDVTTVRQMEQQLQLQQKMASLGELAAGIAHEIRNPLASIRGSVEMLNKRTTNNEADTKLMNIVIREVDRLNQLITDFLTYAKPLSPQYQKVNLTLLINDTLALISASHSELAEQISFLQPEHDSIIEADRDQIRQVLWNLLRNAHQACIDANINSPKITCQLEHDSTSCRLFITDNGPGIVKENLQKIFEPFYTTKSKGSGLGLAVVHRIVEVHSGTIAVKSELKKGTTITIEFPIQQEKEH